jgi:hypothetical protein
MQAIEIIQTVINARRAQKIAPYHAVTRDIIEFCKKNGINHYQIFKELDALVEAKKIKSGFCILLDNKYYIPINTKHQPIK